VKQDVVGSWPSTLTITGPLSFAITSAAGDTVRENTHGLQRGLRARHETTGVAPETQTFDALIALWS
jgi:hypothetical protein